MGGPSRSGNATSVFLAIIGHIVAWGVLTPLLIQPLYPVSCAATIDSDPSIYKPGNADRLGIMTPEGDKRINVVKIWVAAVVAGVIVLTWRLPLLWGVVSILGLVASIALPISVYKELIPYGMREGVLTKWFAALAATIIGPPVCLVGVCYQLIRRSKARGGGKSQPPPEIVGGS